MKDKIIELIVLVVIIVVMSWIAIHYQILDSLFTPYER